MKAVFPPCSQYWKFIWIGCSICSFLRILLNHFKSSAWKTSQQRHIWPYSRNRRGSRPIYFVMAFLTSASYTLYLNGTMSRNPSCRTYFLMRASHNFLRNCAIRMTERRAHWIFLRKFQNTAFWAFSWVIRPHLSRVGSCWLFVLVPHWRYSFIDFIQ